MQATTSTVLNNTKTSDTNTGDNGMSEEDDGNADNNGKNSEMSLNQIDYHISVQNRSNFHLKFLFPPLLKHFQQTWKIIRSNLSARTWKL